MFLLRQHGMVGSKDQEEEQVALKNIQTVE